MDISHQRIEPRFELQISGTKKVTYVDRTQNINSALEKRKMVVALEAMLFHYVSFPDWLWMNETKKWVSLDYLKPIVVVISR